LGLADVDSTTRISHSLLPLKIFAATSYAFPPSTLNSIDLLSQFLKKLIAIGSVERKEIEIRFNGARNVNHGGCLSQVILPIGGIGIRRTSVNGNYTTPAGPPLAAVSNDVSGIANSPAVSIGFGIDKSLGAHANAGIGAEFLYLRGSSKNGWDLAAIEAIALQAKLGFNILGYGRQ
jgi:hypothetical protein